jgi:CPA1 family monovalent cation:H+ antiporter
MQDNFIQYIYLVLIILALVMLANKLRLAYPIILVLGGLVLSFVHVFSNITIDPELIFFIFLPPLLYEAAWQVSWKQFWKYRRVIMSFAFPIVILTSCVVAYASYVLIPGFTLALGFLLGGIVSPPDAISASTIMRQVKAPKSLVSIAEGESLLNDASSLVVFRFALAAVVTGQFRLQDAAMNFFLVIIMGSLIGPCHCIGFLYNSSLADQNSQCRDSFNAGNSLRHVLFCGVFSFLRCTGCCMWRFVLIKQASNHAYL